MHLIQASFLSKQWGEPHTMQINVNFIFNWEIFFRILHNFEFLDSLLSPFPKD